MVEPSPLAGAAGAAPAAVVGPPAVVAAPPAVVAAPAAVVAAAAVVAPPELLLELSPPQAAMISAPADSTTAVRKPARPPSLVAGLDAPGLSPVRTLIPGSPFAAGATLRSPPTGTSTCGPHGPSTSRCARSGQPRRSRQPDRPLAGQCGDLLLLDAHPFRQHLDRVLAEARHGPLHAAARAYGPLDRARVLDAPEVAVVELDDEVARPQLRVPAEVGPVLHGRRRHAVALQHVGSLVGSALLRPGAERGPQRVLVAHPGRHVDDGAQALPVRLLDDLDRQPIVLTGAGDDGGEERAGHEVVPPLVGPAGGQVVHVHGHHHRRPGLDLREVEVAALTGHRRAAQRRQDAEGAVV